MRPCVSTPRHAHSKPYIPVCSSYYNNSPQTGSLKPQAFLARGSGGWEVRDQGAGRRSSFPVGLSSWLAASHLLTASSRGGGARRHVFWGLFHNDTNLIMCPHPTPRASSNPNDLPRVPSPITIALEVRASPCESGQGHSAARSQSCVWDGTCVSTRPTAHVSRRQEEPEQLQAELPALLASSL